MSPRPIVFACLLAAASALWSASQEPQTFELKAVKLGLPDLPSLYFFRRGPDGKTERVRLEVPEQMVGAPARFRAGETVRLYAAKEGSEPADGVAPFLEVPGAAADGKKLIVFHPDESGAPRHDVLDSSLGEHPVASVRMVNLAAKRVAFSVGGTPVPVLPGGSATLRPTPDEKGRFPFQFFEERAGDQPYRSPKANFRFRFPDHRMLVVFANVREESQDNPDDPSAIVKATFRPQAVFVFDRTGQADLSSNPQAAAPSPRPPAGSSPAAPISLGITAAPTPQGGRLEILHMSRGGELVLGSGAQATKITLKAGEIVSGGPGATGELALAADPGRPVARLVPGTSSALVVLADGESDGSTRSAVFDDSPQSHPPGRLRIFNMTPYQLAYSGGESSLAYIDPLGSHLVGGNGGTLKLAAKAPGGWKLITSGDEDPVLPGTRGYLFVRKLPGADEFATLRKSR